MNEDIEEDSHNKLNGLEQFDSIRDNYQLPLIELTPQMTKNNVEALKNLENEIQASVFNQNPNQMTTTNVNFFKNLTNNAD